MMQSTLESVVGIKPGECGAVIGYQGDKFTPSLLAELSVISHTFILVWWASCQHLPTSFLNQGIRMTPFFTKHLKTDGLDSILTNSIETLELDAFFEEADTRPSSISSGFLHFVGTNSDISKLQFAPSIKSG